MKTKRTITGLLVALLMVPFAYALEIKFGSGKQMYLNHANPQRGTYDIVAHMVLIKNDSNERITLQNVDYSFLAGNRIVEEKHLDVTDLVSATTEVLDLEFARNKSARSKVEMAQGKSSLRHISTALTRRRHKSSDLLIA